MVRFMIIASIPVLLGVVGLTRDLVATGLAATGMAVLVIVQAVTRVKITPFRAFAHVLLTGAVMAGGYVLYRFALGR